MTATSALLMMLLSLSCAVMIALYCLTACLTFPTAKLDNVSSNKPSFLALSADSLRAVTSSLVSATCEALLSFAIDSVQNIRKKLCVLGRIFSGVVRRRVLYEKNGVIGRVLRVLNDDNECNLKLEKCWKGASLVERRLHDIVFFDQ